MALSDFIQEDTVMDASKNVMFCIAIKKTEQQCINRINRYLKKVQDESEEDVNKAFVWVDKNVRSRGFSHTNAKESFYLGTVEPLGRKRSFADILLRALIVLEQQSGTQEKSENELYFMINSALSDVETTTVKQALHAFRSSCLTVHLVKDESCDKINTNELEEYITELGGQVISINKHEG